jgi:hypothetical protein
MFFDKPGAVETLHCNIVANKLVQCTITSRGVAKLTGLDWCWVFM